MDVVRVPSKSTPTLEQYENRFRKLNVGVHRGVPRLHKPCLLLAVIELAESEGLQGNRIHYGPALIERFARYISEAHPEVSPSKACYPMVYLRSDGFWRLHPKPGLEGEIQKNPKGGHEFEFLRENVEFISLDEDLHKLLSDAESREKLRNVLIDKWFQSCRENIRKQISRAREESDYEKQLKGSLRIGEETKEKIRKPVFRRLVLRAYDHSCAATGLRFPMFDGTSLLEAAHIKPFSEFHDDRTVNGMALEPTYHRAMDQYLIAPGPDLKWHVSGFLDDQINGHEALVLYPCGMLPVPILPCCGTPVGRFRKSG